jgi:hypothetical protein
LAHSARLRQASQHLSSDMSYGFKPGGVLTG